MSFKEKSRVFNDGLPSLNGRPKHVPSLKSEITRVTKSSLTTELTERKSG